MRSLWSTKVSDDISNMCIRYEYNFWQSVLENKLKHKMNMSEPFFWIWFHLAYINLMVNRIDIDIKIDDTVSNLNIWFQDNT